MKKYVVYLLLSVAGFFSACDNEGSVNIVSLNTFGSKVCRNDNVKVFVSAETSGEDLPTYEWGCSGGALTNPPGLFENVWKAPNEPGEYEIWVTVERNGAKDTRRAKITVLDELFYSDFEAPYYNEGYSNSNMTLKQDTKTGSVSLTASKDEARFQRNWDAELGVAPPYSMQMKYQPTSFKADNVIDFRIAFMALEEELARRLSNINFSVEPLTGEYCIKCNYYDMFTGMDVVLELEKGQNDLLKSMNIWRYIAISIDETNRFVVYCDGTKLVESNILSEHFDQASFPIQGSGLFLTHNKSALLVDDLLIIDNGDICTATERIR